jgi:hypothetical protein
LPKKRIYDHWEIPTSVVHIVKSVCADYDRRAAVIASGEYREQYVNMNAAIDLALLSVEEGIRRIMLEDISHGRGYDFSPASPYLAKNSYYLRKRKAIHDIAIFLGFL